MKRFILLLAIIAFVNVNSIVYSQTSQTVAQDFTVVDVDGNQYHLFDILAQGKYVYLECSFVGCTYCVAQIPDMNDIYTSHGCNQKDVVFLSFFSPSDDSTALVQYRIDHGPIEYPLIFGIHDDGSDNGGSVYSYYDFPGNPDGCLIAPDHSIVENDLYPNSGANNVLSNYGIGEYPCGIVADFVGNPLTIPYGGSVDFTDLSSNYTPTSWNWTFQGAQTSTSTQQNPSNITYISVGSFDVSLTVSDGNTTDDEIKHNYITVLAPTSLTAQFSANHTTIIEGQTVDFTDLTLGGTPTSWDWDFTGAQTTTSTQQNPSGIEYDTPGLYTVSLTASDGTNTDTETKTDFIEVLDSSYLPKADFVANYTTIYAGGSVDFTDLTTGIPTSWEWTFTGASTASSTQQNPSGIVYPNVGFYPVKLIVVNSYGSDTITKIDYIKVIDATYLDTVITDFKATTSRLISAGQMVSFEDLSSGYPTSWSWEFEGGLPGVSNLQHPQDIKYNSPGIYKVKLIANNGVYSGQKIKEDYIVVTDYPWPDPNGFCDSISNIQSFETVVPPIKLSDQWGYFPGHNGYSIKSYADKFTNYTFSQVNEMKINTRSVFKASTNAKVRFVIWDVDSLGNPGNELAYKNVPMNNLTPYYNNTISFDTPAQINGEFFAGFTLYYAADQDTFSVYMADNRGNGATNTVYVKKGYTWETMQNITGDVYNTSLDIKLSVCLVNVDEVELNKNLKVYPNPSNGNVYINFGDMYIDNYKFKVYDILGNIIDVKSYKNAKNEFSLDFSNQKQGFYYIKINANSALKTVKVLIIK